MPDERSHHHQAGLGVVADQDRNFLVLAGRENVLRQSGHEGVFDVHVTVDERLPRVVDEHVVSRLIIGREHLGKVRNSDFLKSCAAHLRPQTFEDGLVEVEVEQRLSKTSWRSVNPRSTWGRHSSINFSNVCIDSRH